MFYNQIKELLLKLSKTPLRSHRSIIVHQALIRQNDADPKTIFERAQACIYRSVKTKTEAEAFPCTLEEVISGYWKYSRENVDPETHRVRIDVARAEAVVDRVPTLEYSCKEQKALKQEAPAYSLGTYDLTRPRDEQGRLLPRSQWPKVSSERLVLPDNPAERTRLITIDVDLKDNPQLATPAGRELMREQLADDPYVFYAAPSISGTDEKGGIYALLEVPPGCTEEQRRDHYAAAAIYFKREFGLTIDPACKDVARARLWCEPRPIAIRRYPEVFSFTTADFEPATKATAAPVTSAKPFATSAPKATPAPLATHELSHNAAQDYPNTFEGVKQAIEDARKRGGLHFDEEQRWFVAGMVLAREFGPGGYDLFAELSKLSPKYNGVDCNKKYNYCLRKCWDYKGEPAKLASVFYDLKHES